MSKGVVKKLTAMINGMSVAGQAEYALNLSAHKNDLLTNGCRPPIPAKTLNQRQKRKRARQIH